jgi:hypothetical protein
MSYTLPGLPVGKAKAPTFSRQVLRSQARKESKLALKKFTDRDNYRNASKLARSTTFRSSIPVLAPIDYTPTHRTGYREAARIWKRKSIANAVANAIKANAPEAFQAIQFLRDMTLASFHAAVSPETFYFPPTPEPEQEERAPAAMKARNIVLPEPKTERAIKRAKERAAKAEVDKARAELFCGTVLEDYLLRTLLEWQKWNACASISIAKLVGPKLGEVAEIICNNDRAALRVMRANARAKELGSGRSR